MGPSLFFPESRVSSAVAPAMQYCATCPVQDQCAEAGTHERYGIWAGELRVQHPHRPARGRSTAILDGAAGFCGPAPAAVMRG
jgi:hypothetical protein